MLPLLLAQLEHLDAGELLKSLLGPLGGAGIAGLIVRQWAAGRLATLSALEKRSRRDNARWKLMVRYMRLQGEEINRQRHNAHQLRNALGSVLFSIEQLAEACHVRVRLPTREELEERWEPGKLEPVDFELEEGEDEEGDK